MDEWVKHHVECSFMLDSFVRPGWIINIYHFFSFLLQLRQKECLVRLRKGWLGLKWSLSHCKPCVRKANFPHRILLPAFLLNCLKNEKSWYHKHQIVQINASFIISNFKRLIDNESIDLILNQSSQVFVIKLMRLIIYCITIYSPSN